MMTAGDEVLAHPESIRSTAGAVGVAEAIARMVDQVRHGVVEVGRRGRGGGAGILWSPDGRVLTNYHVVAGTGGRPHVQLYDGRWFETETLAENPALDLALLKIDAAELPALLPADSRAVRVGELVFAVGHPWGHKDVVTMGIVSGVGKVNGNRSGRSADYIRSDVRLAPGNSGGPLLNARGQVLGINSMIFGGDLAVAVPSHVAMEWLASQGRRYYLGVGVRPVRLNGVWGEESEPGVVRGVLVISVDPTGPAARAGIRQGDVLLSVADQEVFDTASVRNAISSGLTESGVHLHVLRGGKAVEVVAVPRAAA